MGEMTILRPFFGRGMAQSRLGAEVPELHQKFSLLLGAPVVPKAQIWSSKKICLGPPIKGVARAHLNKNVTKLKTL